MKYLFYLSFLFGCSNIEKSNESETVEPVSEPSSQPETPQDSPGSNSNSVGEADLVPVTSRDARRLSIRAISASLTQVTGVEWLENGKF